MEQDVTLKNIKGKDVTLKEGDDLVFPRTFARNVFLNNESLETILAALVERISTLENNSDNKGTTVVANPDTIPTEVLNTTNIDNTTYEINGGIEIIREEE